LTKNAQTKQYGEAVKGFKKGRDRDEHTTGIGRKRSADSAGDGTVQEKIAAICGQLV
jgi:hypothetical protein